MTALVIELSVRAPSVSVSLRTDTDTLLIVGPSGAGKSTLLRAMAGLVAAEGSLVVGGHVWLDGQRATPPRERGAAWLPQDVALFPHLSVRRNLAFGGAANGDIDAIADELGIGALLDRAPAALSGGEQQRAGIARTLLSRAEVLLFDEPLSALDEATAENAAGVIRARAAGRLVVVAAHSEARARMAGVVLEAKLGAGTTHFAARSSDAERAR